MKTAQLFTGLLFLSTIFLLCSCGYRADRYDERVVTLEADQFNLYKLYRLEVLDDLNQPVNVNRPPGDQLKPLMYGTPVNGMADADSYAVVSILMGRTPPVVQIYQERLGIKESEPVFSIPLSGNNSLLLRHEDNGIRTFQILLSLRHDTLMPIICKNNYELFILTLRNDEQAGTWEIAEFKPVTNGDSDAVQAVFNASGSQIAYVAYDRKERMELIVMNRDGTDRKVVASNGMLPCFMESGNLLFVLDLGIIKEFFCYEPKTGLVRYATADEVAGAIRNIPYSALKEFYLRFGRGRATLAEHPPQKTMTLKDLAEYGFANSPLILQNYYEYLAIKARNTQNLYDLGPDFFMGADYLVTSAILFETPNDPYYVIGDRIGNDNFIRFLSGFSIPVIPNLPLRWAQRYYDDWREMYARAAIMKSVNEFSGKLAIQVFYYWEARERLEGIRQQLARNTKRIERYEVLQEAGLGTSERVIFARNIQAGLESDLNAVAEQLIRCQVELAALLGFSPTHGIRLEPIFGVAEKLESMHSLHSIEWFQGQARLNRQELRQLDALIQQDAATRDMGPERTRIDAVRLSVSYGVGFVDWQKLIDDFLLLGVSYAVPMRLPIFFESYYDDYGNRIEVLRMRKYQLDGAIQGEIFSAYADYSTACGRSVHREKRYDTLREKSRLDELHQRYGSAELGRGESDSDDYTSQLDTLDERNTGVAGDYERLRRLAALYQSAGRATKFLRDAVILLDNPVAPLQDNGIISMRGIYLWKAPELIQSKKLRDEFMANCKNNDIKLVYCYFSMKKDRIPFLELYEPEYAFFIECCRRNNIRAVALIGEPEWIDPAQREDMNALLNAYLKFNRERQARGEFGFDGLSLDVEPHSLPEWETGRDKLIANYLSLLEQAADKVGRENLNVAVPYTYNGVFTDGDDNDLLYEVAARTGSITLMAYRNSFDKIMEKALPILSRRDLQIPIFVALETNFVDDPGVSFFGNSKTDFMSIVQRCTEAFTAYPNFAGIVIHDNAGFTQMR